MRSLRRIAVPVAVASALLAVGCGETVIDDVKTEDAIQHNLEKEVGARIDAVDCPTDVEVETGGRFDCEVELADGSSQTAELRILNEDADVELVRLVPGGGGGGGGEAGAGGGDAGGGAAGDAAGGAENGPDQ